MSIVIGADAAGLRLKDLVKEFLVKKLRCCGCNPLKVKIL